MKPRTSRPARPAGSKGQSHRVRIIGGRFRRTLLPVIDAPSLRPTPDRVRETLFNWLAHLFDHDFAELRALDLFAGTGALGMEALSRGFGHVTFVEHDPRAAASLDAVLARLGATNAAVHRRNAYSFIQGTTDHYDVIFLDPPFDQARYAELLHLASRALRPHGLLYVEAGEALALPSGFALVRTDRAGAVHFYLLQPATTPTADPVPATTPSGAESSNDENSPDSR